MKLKWTRENQKLDQNIWTADNTHTLLRFSCLPLIFSTNRRVSPESGQSSGPNGPEQGRLFTQASLSPASPAIPGFIPFSGTSKWNKALLLSIHSFTTYPDSDHQTWLPRLLSRVAFDWDSEVPPWCHRQTLTRRVKMDLQVELHGKQPLGWVRAILWKHFLDFWFTFSTTGKNFLYQGLPILANSRKSHKHHWISCE